MSEQHVNTGYSIQGRSKPSLGGGAHHIAGGWTIKQYLHCGDKTASLHFVFVYNSPCFLVNFLIKLGHMKIGQYFTKLNR